MPRLFIGIKPPNVVRKRLQSHMKTSGMHAHSLRVSPPEKWHITIHFIGNVTPRAAEKIRETFTRAKLPVLNHPSRIKLGGKNTFQTFGNDVLFVDVNGVHENLSTLNSWAKELVPVTQTHSAYRPHLTLARNPKGISLQQLVHEHGKKSFEEEFPIREIILFDSRSMRGKTTYHRLAARRIIPHNAT
ncbi:MAG: RNA 2',3'-cyclic phosphodiesterase [Candidatus Diapherotrites archaeon]|uniref:RNA 2',3'-cyclic phosphodiesterase n=1 Tax=Candidatus Iainarchaeum sp. TaxID=3101447 RepID=A0A8T4C7Q1_9ARCH|nr:RNA 2',3'-cyclic phosphodiesterase [Candidatus Diapherotrites archaeon]